MKNHLRSLLILSILFLLGLPHSAPAHNGAVTIAVPVEEITVDGDLSDWPDYMHRYPISGSVPIGYGILANIRRKQHLQA